MNDCARFSKIKAFHDKNPSIVVIEVVVEEVEELPKEEVKKKSLKKQARAPVARRSQRPWCCDRYLFIARGSTCAHGSPCERAAMLFLLFCMRISAKHLRPHVCSAR